MCGRITLTTPSDELAAAFPDFRLPPDLAPRYNIAPGQNILAVPNNGNREAGLFRWGLVPSWSNDPSIGNSLINARAETLAEKPSFRVPFRKRRCLILCDGFFEWKREGKRKLPFYIRMKQGRPFAMAGLWEIWHPPFGEALRSCTIITTGANGLVGSIHDRMPVILKPDDFAVWLSPEAGTGSDDLKKLLIPFETNALEAYPVSPIVNSPGTDSPACITPLRLPTPGPSPGGRLF